jgi:PHD/YefM family antitoxin component YafN of YafNO toxin-antitoxin module
MMKVMSDLKKPKQLKEFLELAKSKPIKITRKDQSAFVLMTEEYYNECFEEIQNLQRRLKGSSDIIMGKTQPYIPRHKKKT